MKPIPMFSEMLRVKIVPASTRLFGAALLCMAPHTLCKAADGESMAELYRAIEALREENRALAKRLEILEGKRADPLERRVKELESGKSAQEDAVRTIVRDTVTTLGPKINEAAALSGTLNTRLAREKDFSGTRESALGLSSTDFELEIRMSEWASGHVKLDYVDGKAMQFQTAAGTTAPVDRLTLDTGYITLGNQQKLQPLLSMGRMVLPFGTSTGHPVTDALSIGNALTVDAFEMRHNTIGLNFGFPTPPLRPRTPPVVAPRVDPQVIYPMLKALGYSMGYSPPPARPPLPNTLPEEPGPPPYSAGIYVYDGLTPGGNSRHIGTTLGYRTKGNCGRRYEDLTRISLCPWTLDLALSYNSSVFNSQFLETEYNTFLPQIGRVPGVGLVVRSTLGPFSLVGEWNSATKYARFNDELGTPIAIKPSAWQVSLGYQLGWNPWVKEIGAQGSYLSIGYSRTRDLAGVRKEVNATQTRVGFVPKERLLLTFGEWIVSGVRFTVEYSHDRDYPVEQGGTERSANGIAAMFTYAW